MALLLVLLCLLIDVIYKTYAYITDRKVYIIRPKATIIYQELSN